MNQILLQKFMISNITPKVISPDQMVYVFKFIAREREIDQKRKKEDKEKESEKKDAGKPPAAGAKPIPNQ
jgi:hypothetical protein